MKMRLFGTLLGLLLHFGMMTPANATPDSRAAIKTSSQFDAFARKVILGRQSPFPQVMFVIDRQFVAKSGKPKLYFVNSKKFAFHIDFIRRKALSTQSLEQLLDISYESPNRRFLLGSVVRYPALNRYGVEFWQGDRLDATLLDFAMKTVGAAFPAPLAFVPNSEPHLALARALPAQDVIEAGSVYGASENLVLNAGEAVGRLKILKRVERETLLGKSDVVILEEVPLWLSPVAAIITAEFSTPLAHINLLAKSWKVPNGYVRGAAEKYRALDGEMVHVSAKGDAITIRAATPAEIAKAAIVRQQQAVRAVPADLAFGGLPALVEQRKEDVIRTGAKASNLGEVARRLAKMEKADFAVPSGFSIPFSYYEQFIRLNTIDRNIDALLADEKLAREPALMRSALERLRLRIQTAPLPPEMLATLVKRRDDVIGNVGVFARSSTNSEDLKGFNGAGLYSSVPNVKGDAALGEAIKLVWASVWNDRAFDARAAAGIDHKSVKAAVLVQRAMNAESSGVMITQNPFNPADPGAVFINAKRGLGMRVVEGRRVAEQLIYRADPESVQLLTRSGDDAMLSFDENGGVKEVSVEPGHVVLTDDLARRLARAGLAIERMFGGEPQDIEWLVIGGVIHIVQSRPYLNGK
jgi:rifampicin phosphotransferase